MWLSGSFSGSESSPGADPAWPSRGAGPGGQRGESATSQPLGLCLPQSGHVLLPPHPCPRQALDWGGQPPGQDGQASEPPSRQTAPSRRPGTGPVHGDGNRSGHLGACLSASGFLGPPTGPTGPQHPLLHHVPRSPQGTPHLGQPPLQTPVHRSRTGQRTDPLVPGHVSGTSQTLPEGAGDSRQSQPIDCKHPGWSTPPAPGCSGAPSSPHVATTAVQQQTVAKPAALFPAPLHPHTGCFPTLRAGPRAWSQRHSPT